MSFSSINVHSVWTTKHREPLLKEPFRHLLFEHMRETARSKKLHIEALNGYVDHVHCLFHLNVNCSLDYIMQSLKGESSHWFNNLSGFDCGKLTWQEKYYAVSVSESLVPTVKAYIDRQVQHHQKVTFLQEYAEMVKSFGFMAMPIG